AQKPHDALEDQGDIGNPTAAASEGDAVPGPDGFAQVEFFQRGAHGRGDVLDAGPLELLPQTNEIGIDHEFTRKNRRKARKASPMIDALSYLFPGDLTRTFARNV